MVGQGVSFTLLYISFSITRPTDVTPPSPPPPPPSLVTHHHRRRRRHCRHHHHCCYCHLRFLYFLQACSWRVRQIVQTCSWTGLFCNQLFWTFRYVMLKPPKTPPVFVYSMTLNNLLASITQRLIKLILACLLCQLVWHIFLRCRAKQFRSDLEWRRLSSWYANGYPPVFS